MNADQRIRLFIGDLVVQLQAALAQIEEMRILLEERSKKKD